MYKYIKISLSTGKDIKEITPEQARELRSNEYRVGINCKCGMGCDYKPSTYERVNKLDCNNSRNL